MATQCEPISLRQIGFSEEVPRWTQWELNWTTLSWTNTELDRFFFEKGSSWTGQTLNWTDFFWKRGGQPLNWTNSCSRGLRFSMGGEQPRQPKEKSSQNQPVNWTTLNSTTLNWTEWSYSHHVLTMGLGCLSSSVVETLNWTKLSSSVLDGGLVAFVAAGNRCGPI